MYIIIKTGQYNSGGNIMNNEDQKIKFNVESCDYQNIEENCCTLKEIQVGCCCDKPKNEDETACKSFKCSKNCSN